MTNMLANREGRFHAYPMDLGVNETGSNNLTTAIIQFAIVEELAGEEKADISQERLEITGYFYLEKKDGSINTFAVDALKGAFGWDGRDPFWLEDNAEALRQKPVQITLGFEQYDGKVKLKVQFLNPYGSTAGVGVSHADDAKRRVISNRLGSKLRALAGGSAVAAPLPAGGPTLPTPLDTPTAVPAAMPTAALPAAPEAAVDETPPPATMGDAWSAFLKATSGDKWDNPSREKEWHRILGELFPGKGGMDFTDADWGVMLAKGPGMILPF